MMASSQLHLVAASPSTPSLDASTVPVQLAYAAPPSSPASAPSRPPWLTGKRTGLRQAFCHMFFFWGGVIALTVVTVMLVQAYLRDQGVSLVALYIWCYPVLFHLAATIGARRNPIYLEMAKGVPRAELDATVDRLRSATTTSVTFHVECSHMENTSYTDSEGESYSRREKVVTHDVTETFWVARATDATAAVVPDTAAIVTFEARLAFDDAACRQRYTQQRERLIAQYRGLDQAFVFEEKLELGASSDLPEVVVVCGDRSRLVTRYWLLVLCALSWPFLLDLTNRSAVVTIVKRLGSGGGGVDPRTMPAASDGNLPWIVSPTFQPPPPPPYEA